MPDLRDPVAVVQVGHEIRPRAREQLDALVVDQRPVLDRTGAGSCGDLDALGAVGMGGDEQRVRGRFLDAGPDRRLVELDDVGAGASRQDGAGHDQLDEVRAAGGELADPLPALSR